MGLGATVGSEPAFKLGLVMPKGMQKSSGLMAAQAVFLNEMCFVGISIERRFDHSRLQKNIRPSGYNEEKLRREGVVLRRKQAAPLSVPTSMSSTGNRQKGGSHGVTRDVWLPPDRARAVHAVETETSAHLTGRGVDLHFR